MREIATVIDTSSTNPEKYADWSYPEGYENLKRIEVKKQKNGEQVPYGVYEIGGVERQFPMPDLVEMWGHDPEEYGRYNENREMWELKKQVVDLSKQVEILSSKIDGRGSRNDGENPPPVPLHPLANARFAEGFVFPAAFKETGVDQTEELKNRNLDLLSEVRRLEDENRRLESENSQL